MLNTRRIIIATLCLLFLVAGVGACKRGCHPGGFDKFDLAAAIDRVASRLDLTDAQKTDLKQIAGEIAEKAKAMYVDRESRHQVFADLVRQDTIARDEVDGLVAEKMEQMEEMVDFAAKRLITFHGTLTQEQRETIATHIEERSSGGCRFGLR